MYICDLINNPAFNFNAPFRILTGALKLNSGLLIRSPMYILLPP